MKVKPKKSNAAIHKQIIKKTEYDKKIKEARNIGVKMGALVMCRVISGIKSQTALRSGFFDIAVLKSRKAHIICRGGRPCPP